MTKEIPNGIPVAFAMPLISSPNGAGRVSANDAYV